MFAHLLARALGASGRRFAHPPTLFRLCAALLAVALAGGCSTVPSAPLSGADPSDPGAPSRRSVYRTVVGPYASQRPGDPSEWRGQNDRIAPEAKP